MILGIPFAWKLSALFLTLRWKYLTFLPGRHQKGKKNTPLKQHYDMSTEEVIKFKDIETGDEIFFFNVSDMIIHKVEVYNTLKTIRLVQLNTNEGCFVVDANRSSCGLDSEDTWKNPQIYVATSEEIIERWKKRIEEKRK